MRWLFLIVGGAATVAMLGISMRLNFLFGYSLGQTSEKAWVFGWVSVISDAWKALGPIFILALFRARRRWSTSGASAIWIACFLYSVSSALGVAIEDRSSRTGNRETIVTNYEETKAELERLEKRRAALGAHRSAAEVEAAINAVLLRPVESYQRIRGTVGEISNNCQRADSRTMEACAEVAQLRKDLAAATEERDLDQRIAELTAQAQQLRERGGMKAADPQAQLLARLSGGRVSPDDVGPGLSLLLAMTIELVSAFGPTVLSSYAEATEAGERKQPDKPVGLVIDYLADRIEPAANTEKVSESTLYTDYNTWCRVSGRAALSTAEFVTAFDRVRVENGLGKIRKRKGSYCGIRVATSHETLTTG